MLAISGCARESSGGVSCWGLSGGPSPVDGIDRAVLLAGSGGTTSCYVHEDGSLWCWGSNEAGQIGDGTLSYRAGPTAALGMSNVLHAEHRAATTCGVRADRAVLCWGANDSGQVGKGTVSPAELVPMPVLISPGEPLLDGREVSIGVAHACAITATGEVYCWGANDRGQLGRDTAGASAPFAARVEGLPPLVHMASAAFSNCGVDEEGDVWCWGKGGQGQMADGQSLDRIVPVEAFNACL